MAAILKNKRGIRGSMGRIACISLCYGLHYTKGVIAGFKVYF